MMGRLKILFDGAAETCRGGRCAFGWVMYRDGYPVEEQGGLIPEAKTNNEAEYHAVIMALLAAKAFGYTSDELEIVGDSQIVINQLDGFWKIKAVNLRPLFERATELAREFQSVTYRWVPEGLNAEAHSLAVYTIEEARREAIPTTEQPE